MLLHPEWPAPEGVGAAFSTRQGGVSAAPFDSLNLRPPGLRGDAIDAPEAVRENQRRFAAALG
ncbi:laccase domain-containing protein, partial [Rubrivivax gelatinosus]